MTATVRSRDRSRGVVAVVVGDVSYGEVGQAEELDLGTEFCFGEHEAAQVPMELVDGERRPGPRNSPPGLGDDVCRKHGEGVVFTCAQVQVGQHHPLGVRVCDANLLRELERQIVISGHTS